MSSKVILELEAESNKVRSYFVEVLIILLLSALSFFLGNWSFQKFIFTFLFVAFFHLIFRLILNVHEYKNFVVTRNELIFKKFYFLQMRPVKSVHKVSNVESINVTYMIFGSGIIINLKNKKRVKVKVEKIHFDRVGGLLTDPYFKVLKGAGEFSDEFHTMRLVKIKHHDNSKLLKEHLMSLFRI